MVVVLWDRSGIPSWSARYRFSLYQLGAFVYVSSTAVSFPLSYRTRFYSRLYHLLLYFEIRYSFAGSAPTSHLKGTFLRKVQISLHSELFKKLLFYFKWHRQGCEQTYYFIKGFCSFLKLSFAFHWTFHRLSSIGNPSSYVLPFLFLSGEYFIILVSISIILFSAPVISSCG